MVDMVKLSQKKQKTAMLGLIAESWINLLLEWGKRLRD